MDHSSVEDDDVEDVFIPVRPDWKLCLYHHEGRQN